MNKITRIVLVVLIILSAGSCGAEKNWTPDDYPDSDWNCEGVLSFSISEGVIRDAVLYCGEDKETISAVFSGVQKSEVVLSSSDGDKAYARGVCTFYEKQITIMVVEVYNKDYCFIPLMINMERE